jgi:hypothetical protein
MATQFYLRLWNTPEQTPGKALQEKDGAYLSRNGRLVSFNAAAVLSSEGAAQMCIALWMPRLQYRWGNGTRIEIERVNMLEGCAEVGDLDAITLIARARSGRFAPNVPVPLDAMEAARMELASAQPG